MQRALIWDLPTRLFHWALATSFGVAYLTSEGDRWRSVHVFFGYLLLALVIFRIFWGFAGSHYARFSSFWFSPKEALDYLKQVLARSAPRHVGHNPTGSIAIYILLALAVVVSVTGVLTLGGDEQQGIAAGWFTFSQIKLMKGFHELAANGMLLVVLGHIAGVVVESVLHKENLARSMVTGFKMAGADTPLAKQSKVVAALMLVTMMGFAGWWFYYAIDRTIEGQESHVVKDDNKAEELHVKFVGKTLPDNAQWREECGSCHGVFYPALLPARSWEKIMAEQAQHFGSDLGLDDATAKSVLAFMVANSAEKHQIEAGYKIESSLAKGATPLRITETPYWVKKHRELAASDWANPLVKSKNNCSACHVDAEVGTYEDAAMRIPKAARPVTSVPAAASVKP
jgi:cytochrome b/nitrate/TMAO reductase-like tetraheme cytochrome c subunit